MPERSAVGRPEVGDPGWPLPGLVAALTLLTLELVRSSGPLLDTVYGRSGVVAVTLAAVATYAVPGLVAAVLLVAVRRRHGGRAGATLLVGAALLAGLRLVVQALSGPARVAVGLATVAVAVAVLTLAVAALAGRPGGGRRAAGAVATGAAAGVGVQLGLGTWDAYWRHGPLAWTVAALVAGTVVTTAALTARDLDGDADWPVRRLWALGPLLALAAMMLANPAFAAAQSGLPLAVAGPLHAAGLLLAEALARRPVPVRGSRPFAAVLVGAVLVLLVGAALERGGRGPLDSLLVLLALLGAQLAAVALLGRALDPTPGRLRPGALAGSAALVGLVTIVPLLVYQLDYETPLGFPHLLVLLAPATLLAAAGVRRPRVGVPASGRPPQGSRRVLLAGLALVLLGSAVAAGTATAHRSREPAAGAATAGSGVVLTWNLHYGVTPAGAVDLEGVARAIEAQDPDVVLLQEVSRGWVQGGGVDMATWLSQRLDRPYAFGPAADRRFGNVVLARSRPRRVRVTELPYGAGPQHRSALTAEVALGGRTLAVTSVHLQQRTRGTATRLQELEVLLAARPDATAGEPEVVGGDLNAAPGRPEIGLLTSAGFVSALDVAGDPAALTNPNPAPTRRIDWVLGRGVGFTEAHVLPEVSLSDHRPVVATVAP